MRLVWAALPAGTAGGHDTTTKMLCNVIPYKTTLKVSFSMFPEKFLFAAGACVLLRKIVILQVMPGG